MTENEEDFDQAALVRELVDRGGFIEFIRQFWNTVEPARFVENWHHGAIAEYLEGVALGQVKKLVIAVPPATSKPVESSQPVWTRRGYIPLSAVVVGDEVLTHLGRWQPVTAVHEQGELPVLRITTNSGRSVLAAGDHPFFTPRGWIEAQHLTLEDTLGCVVEAADELPRFVSNEVARLAGYMVGDGHLPLQGNDSLTNCEPDVASDFTHIVESLGWSVKVWPKKNSKANNYRILSGEQRRVGDALSRSQQLFADLQLRGKNSYTKRIPPQILNGCKEALSHFVGAYWSCDGSIEKRCDKPANGWHGAHRGRAWRVTANTVGEGLASDLQVALQRLGIACRLRTKIAKLHSKKQPGGLYKSYLIEVVGQDSVARVAALPGLCARKQRCFVRNEFDRILLPDLITSIEPAGTCPCRCLTVANDNSFTAAGFAVHNSTVVSALWPAWMWSLAPDKRFLCASFDQSLVLRDAGRMIGCVQSELYQACYPYVQLASKAPALGNFKNTEGGLRFSTTPEGKATGRHAHVAIIDDPMKPQDAVLQRKAAFTKINTWFDTTLPTRAVEPKTFAIVIIAQRLHNDDLSGRALAMGYESLILPMRQTKRTQWARDPRKEPGELLWPERYPEPVVRQLEHTLGNEASAQLQQDPTPDIGGFVEESWTRLEWVEPPKLGTWCQSWDFSSKGSLESHSRVSGQLWCATKELTELRQYLSTLGDRLAKIKGASDDWRIIAAPKDQVHYCLVDFVGGHWNYVQSKAHFAGAQARPLWNRARVKLVELKANGPAIIEEFRSVFHGIKGVEPEGSKEERYRVHTEKWEVGQVVYCPGADDVRSEHIKFPRYTWDDHVDTTTQALDRLADANARYRENLALIAQRGGVAW